MPHIPLVITEQVPIAGPSKRENNSSDSTSKRQISIGVNITRINQSRVMKAISAETILFSAVLLWKSSISNGQTHGTCTTCSSCNPCQLGLHQNTAATSCQEIYQGNPRAASGNYWLSSGQFPSITVTEQYCDMDRTHGGIKGGWMRVAYFNMEDAGTNCPPPLQETNPGNSFCVKPVPASCTSVVYSTHGVPYNRICSSHGISVQVYRCFWS